MIHTYIKLLIDASRRALRRSAAANTHRLHKLTLLTKNSLLSLTMAINVTNYATFNARLAQVVGAGSDSEVAGTMGRKLAINRAVGEDVFAKTGAHIPAEIGAIMSCLTALGDKVLPYGNRTHQQQRRQGRGRPTGQPDHGVRHGLRDGHARRQRRPERLVELRGPLEPPSNQRPRTVSHRSSKAPGYRDCGGSGEPTLVCSRSLTILLPD